MVVMAMRVEDSRNLVPADAQSRKGVLHARPGVDEVDPALEADDASHAGAGDVPPVSFPDVNDGEMLALHRLLLQLVGGRVLLRLREVEVHGHRAALVDELVAVESAPAHEHPFAQLHGRRVDDPKVHQVFRAPDIVEREPPLDPQHVAGQALGNARFHDFSQRGQPVGATVDVVALACDLVFQPDQHGLSAGVVGVVGENHALEVKHLQHGKLRQVGEASVLHGRVGQEDRVRARLGSNAVFLPHRRSDPFHEVLDAVRRAAAQDEEVSFRYFYPVDPIGYFFLFHEAIIPLFP